MCGFPVYCNLDAAILLVVDLNVQKSYGPICFLFMSELDVASTVQGVEIVGVMLGLSNFYFILIIFFTTLFF